MIWKITTTSRQGRHRHNQIQMSQRSQATQHLAKFQSPLAHALALAQAFVRAYFTYQGKERVDWHFSQSKQKPFLLCCVFRAPTPKGGPGLAGWLAAWQVFSVLFFHFFFCFWADCKCEYTLPGPANTASTECFVYSLVGVYLSSSSAL